MRRLIAGAGRAIIAASLATLGSACSTYSALEVPSAEIATQSLPEDRLIEVAIQEFDPGVVPEDEPEWGATPEIRSGEARYMPFQLKQTLQDSGFWGSVWVTPVDTVSAGLRVHGRIEESDGEHVTLAIDAVDATGRVWLDKSYRVEFEAEAYTQALADPYQPVFSLIATDLLAARRERSDEELRELRLVSELRFAEDLSPDAFKGYLAEQKDGRFSVKRLPSRSDPILERVRSLRDREFLLLDTMNDYYSEFHREMDSPYRNWRQFSREEAIALRELRREMIARAVGGVAIAAGAIVLGSGKPSRVNDVLRDVGVTGGVILAGSAIGKYQETKMHKAALDELSASFSSEVAPLVVQIDEDTVRLTGSAKEQFAKWRELLRKLYVAETGMIDIYADPTAIPVPEPDATPTAEPELEVSAPATVEPRRGAARESKP